MSWWTVLLLACLVTPVLSSGQSADVILSEQRPDEPAGSTMLVSVDDPTPAPTSEVTLSEADAAAAAAGDDFAGEVFYVCVFITIFVWLIIFGISYIKATEQYNWEKYIDQTCFEHDGVTEWRDFKSELCVDPKLKSIPMLTNGDFFFLGVVFLDAAFVRAIFSCCGAIKMCRPCYFCPRCENRQTALLWLWIGTFPPVFFFVALLEAFHCAGLYRYDAETKPNGFRDPGPRTFLPYANGEQVMRNKVAMYYRADQAMKRQKDAPKPPAAQQPAGCAKVDLDASEQAHWRSESTTPDEPNSAAPDCTRYPLLVDESATTAVPDRPLRYTLVHSEPAAQQEEITVTGQLVISAPGQQTAGSQRSLPSSLDAPKEDRPPRSSVETRIAHGEPLETDQESIELQKAIAEAQATEAAADEEDSSPRRTRTSATTL